MGKRPKAQKAKPATAAGSCSLIIERVAVSKLKPAPYNPRVSLTPGDPEYQRIKRSLDSFGYVDSLVWNKRSGHLVGGHQRLTVLVAERGVTEVDVSVVDLDDAEEKALSLALNKIDGVWDPDKLATLLDDLKASSDIDLAVTGFSDQELDELLHDAQLDSELRPVAIQPPPKMSWVLIGVPTVDFGEISAEVERIAQVDGVIMESTANDG